MDFFTDLCGKFSIPWDFISWIFFELLLLGFCIFLGYMAFTCYKNWWARIASWTGVVVFFGTGLIVSSFIFMILFKPFETYMGDYFDLNAAIKNTCFLDPQKNHCPHSIEELISIEPEKFIPLTRGTALTIYDFHPDQGRYTLIVRKGDTSAIIFDPRLIDATEYKIDSVSYSVLKCDGKYSIMNPPNIPGPWNNIN